MHATYLLAKMFEYRRVRTMFPVRVSRTTRVHLVSVSNYCLGFLSANRDRAPATLARGLRKLVVAVAAYHHPEVVDTVAQSPSCFGIRILADVVAVRHAALDGAAVDEMFRRKHWRDGGVAYRDSLTAVAAALSRRHQHVWRLVTEWMPFLEAAAAAGNGDRRGRRRHRTLMVNVRCTPLAVLTYNLVQEREFDWLDPRQRLVFSVALTAGTGVRWLYKMGAFSSLDRHVKSRLEGAAEDPSSETSVDAIIDAAYSFCASFEGTFVRFQDGARFFFCLMVLLFYFIGMKILFGDGGPVTSEQLTRLYRLSYDRFDDDVGRPITRDVLIMLWLRLIEAATHTFTLRIYADSKLNYQVRDSLQYTGRSN